MTAGGSGVEDGPEVVLFPMRTRHLPAVLEIERAVQPHPWTENAFASELANAQHDRHWTIAQAGAELIRPSEIANPVANRFSARNRNGISLPDMASTRDGVTRGPFVGLGHSAR